MVQFTKLRLSGFKSFVDSTDLDIGNGLTGIVGPNGCGKSNLVEALRWAMGETSYKRLRGSGMEDVIFNGTADRPARNIAEVTLLLNNTNRDATAFNEYDDLEIVRRIERGEGSAYKVNGKPVRAKDVQLLFADTATGAHSPSLVSQGKVADLINAKPENRRMVLEEAAGISGLHARRHEAELKLRAAEQNLTRVEDVLGTMEGQLGGLKKQARQASRYRNLSGHISKAESLLFLLKWQDTTEHLAQAKEAFDEAEAVVRTQTSTVTELTTKHTEKEAVLPDLRRAETEEIAALQRLKLGFETLEKEEERIAQEKTDAESQLEHIALDVVHEKTQSTEADTALERLAMEVEDIRIAQDGQDDDARAAEDERNKAQNIVDELDTEVTDATKDIASREARQNSLKQRKEELDTRLVTVSKKLAELKNQLDEVAENSDVQDILKDAEKAIEEAEAAATKAKEARDTAETEKEEAEDAVTTKQDVYQQKHKAHAKLTAEAEALETLLKTSGSEDYAPVLDSLTVPAGLEAALATALGDDLEASLDGGAPIHWTEMPDFSVSISLPDGVQPLSELVKAPKALQRALSQIGLVNSDSEGTRYAKDLLPGQCLVTREGAAWRWDGLTITAAATSAETARLQQKNRLKDLTKEIADAEKDLQSASETLDKAKKARDTAAQKAVEARDALQEAQNTLSEARDSYSEQARENAESSSRLAALNEAVSAKEQEQQETQRSLDETNESLKEFEGTFNGLEVLTEKKARLAEARGELGQHQSKLDQISHQADLRRARLDTITKETQRWTDIKTRAEERVDSLLAREEKLKETLTTLEERPDKIEEERKTFLDKIAEAEAAHKQAADTLAEAENIHRETQGELKTAEAGLADAREARALAQATFTSAEEHSEELLTEIRSKFECAPDGLYEKAETSPEADTLPETDAIQTKLDRLLRERDNMGPVNLRAETEAEELQTQMNTMITEKEDLIAAINKLRGGIGRLNRQARERLLTAFETVDNHFQALFTRLFGGGKAHLELIEDDDPLEAGLEIYAQPPGKKLQVLSLLSGGEQTLTSIALIFAMFLTNPAPICVLDEIDAPLDDSNVDRVCTLLEEMARDGTTRFIIITHHRMTMSRMDRLYGVTMAEQGVSQLVSVDLEQHELFEGMAAA